MPSIPVISDDALRMNRLAVCSGESRAFVSPTDRCWVGLCAMPGGLKAAGSSDTIVVRGAAQFSENGPTVLLAVARATIAEKVI